MTRVSGAARLALVAAVFLGGAAPADAQLIRTKPFRGLFRTTQDPADSRDRLDVSAFLSAGHDELGLRAGGVDVPIDPRLSSASFGSLSLFGVYTHTGERTTFTAHGASSTRYYTVIERLSPMNASGGVHFSGMVGRRGTFRLNQTAAYSPYHTFTLAPLFLQEVAAAPDSPPTFDLDSDLRATRRATYSYSSAASYSHQTGRGSRLNLRYGFRYVDVAVGAYDLQSHAAHVSFSQRVGRYGSFHAGGGARLAAYPSSPFAAVTGQDIDTGFSYARPLPFARRTHVAFSTGMGFTTQEESRRLFVSGSASLVHPFTRTWVAALSYHRGNDVLHGFAAPFFTFTDSVSLSVSGRIAGPVTFRTSGAYTHGTFSVQARDNTVDSAFASVRVNVPVIWFLGTYAEGYYAQYRFAARTGLLADFPTERARYGVRGGLSFMLPVVR